MGRPKAKVDARQVQKLARIGCTLDEIATITDVGKATISRRFGTVIAKGREHLKMSIRRQQYKAMMNGNIVMMIWLGKQYLAQADKHDANINAKMPLTIVAGIDGDKV